MLLLLGKKCLSAREGVEEKGPTDEEESSQLSNPGKLVGGSRN